jgi:phenylacetate-CoA ligase
MFDTLRFIHTFQRLTRRKKLSPERMLALQENRFRELLAFAVTNSPFYRKKYRGIDPRRCKLEELPTLTKPEMMANFREVVTDRAIKLTDLERWLEDPANLGKYFRGRYVVCHTSGSQGQPAVIVQDKAAMEMVFACQMARGNALPKGFKEIVKKLFTRTRIGIVTLRPGFYPSGAAFEYMPKAMNRFANVLRLSQTNGMPHVVERLNEFQPNFVSAYASVLEMLAREETAGRLRLRASGRLLQITNMSEPLPLSSRQTIQDVFGVRVVDNYAMAECMALSNGCTQFNGSHINIDQAILEVVDENNRAVTPGAAGSRVLVTNLYNRVQPLIRYEIGDVITISPKPCPCGSNLPLISAIQGRTKDKFWIRSDNCYKEILPYVFMAPLLHCLDLAEHQVVQVERNVFLVRVAPLPGGEVDLERVERMLRQGLETEGLADIIHLKIELVDAIHPDARSGKVKRMLSVIGPPAERIGDGAAADEALPARLVA